MATLTAAAVKNDLRFTPVRVHKQPTVMSVGLIFYLCISAAIAAGPALLIRQDTLHWRHSKRYSPFLDIRRNLFDNPGYNTTHAIYTELYGLYKHPGTQLNVYCVECQSFTQFATGREGCRGARSEHFAVLKRYGSAGPVMRWTRLSDQVNGPCPRQLGRVIRAAFV